MILGSRWVLGFHSAAVHQQRGLLFVKSGITLSALGDFVAVAVRRWSPTPLCGSLGCVHLLSEGFHRGLLSRRGPLVRPTPLGGQRLSCFSD